jgi:DNA modification methylase
MGRQDYQWQHEPILYGWKPGAAHKFYGDRKQTTVWQIDRPMANREHPTMKPLSLCAKAIENSSKGGDIVLDLFGGSGSTLIACEQLNRTCYMMELDPIYCDVIVQRYINLKGHDGDVYLERDGNKIAFSNVT